MPKYLDIYEEPAGQGYTKEAWADVKEYEGLYQVSTYGRVRSLDRDVLNGRGKSYRKPGRIFRQTPNSHGYIYVPLFKNGKERQARVSRLVAESFLPNPQNKPMVNHIDGNKANNAVWNLEWVTASENTQHAHATGLAYVPLGAGNGMARAVVFLSESGEVMTKKKSTVVEIKSWLDGSVLATGEEGETLRDVVVRKVAERASLDGANLYGANLSRASLDGANLSRASLDGANLDGANLYGASLDGANLYGANLSRANLYGANLSRASLDGANLDGANLSRANLYGANLSRASLDGANLDGANLYGASLDGANLYGASLDGANLYGANLSRANLYGANLSRANLYGANLSRASLDGANLYGANLSRANLYGASLSRASLDGANLDGANLSRANLYGANLSRANLYGANLSRANLYGASLDGASLPSPTAVLLAMWGDLSPQLVADLMLYDSTCHPDPEAFQRWADGGACPYADVHVGRAANFSEQRKLWGQGQPCRPYDLMTRVLTEKCPAWSAEQIKQFMAKFKK